MSLTGCFFAGQAADTNEIAKLRNTARLSGLREGKSIRRPRCHQL
jgi:hypothetical protein